MGAGEMTREVKVPATKPEDSSSISRSMWWRESPLLLATLCPPSEHNTIKQFQNFHLIIGLKLKFWYNKENSIPCPTICWIMFFLRKDSVLQVKMLSCSEEADSWELLPCLSASYAFALSIFVSMFSTVKRKIDLICFTPGNWYVSSSPNYSDLRRHSSSNEYTAWYVSQHVVPCDKEWRYSIRLQNNILEHQSNKAQLL